MLAEEVALESVTFCDPVNVPPFGLITGVAATGVLLNSP
jgi:hypothetical protein